jgi:hypothetical protein
VPINGLVDRVVLNGKTAEQLIRLFEELRGLDAGGYDAIGGNQRNGVEASTARRLTC